MGAMVSDAVKKKNDAKKDKLKQKLSGGLSKSTVSGRPLHTEPLAVVVTAVCCGA